MSYDENSFERELINKLNEESSIQNDSENFDMSKQIHRGKKMSQYKSGDYKSKTSLHHKSHRTSKSKKRRNYSESDYSGSCSTCRLRDDSRSTYSERTYTVKSYHNKSMKGKKP